MKNYAVIQHNYSEYLGMIERQLEVRDIGFSYFRPFVGQDVPGNSLQFDALFILGGSWPVNDVEHCPWLDAEKRLIDNFQKGKRPVVGFGFGGLLVAAQAGATVSAEPLHTAYWTTAHKTVAGENDPLAQAVDGRRVFVMYNGTAELPSAMAPILVDDQGRWIAAKPNDLTYAILFRPELKPGMLEDIIMEANRSAPDNIAELLATARDEWDETQRTTDAVVVALVKSLDLMKERKKAPVFQLNVEK